MKIKMFNDKIIDLDENEDRDTPKLIRRIPTEYLMDVVECPNCKYVFSMVYRTDDLKKLQYMHYCLDCGQKLKWSE